MPAQDRRIVVKGISRPMGSGSGEDVELSMHEAAAELATVTFEFDTPDLEKGVEIYVPEENQWLYNAWVDVEIPFDNTALADITVEPAAIGLCGNCKTSAYLLDQPQASNGLSNDLRPNSGCLMAAVNQEGGVLTISQARGVPARFKSTEPLMLYVSADGKCDGTGLPIQCTQGKATFTALILF